MGTPAYSNAHYYGITIGVIYCILFVCGVPIAGMYIIYINRAKMQHRTMRSAFGFLFEGYRDGALYWEFAVLLRKVAILAVSLFWQDAFLQSVAALFVLMISIVMHLWFLPYEQSFLNNAELASLISLFTLSGVSLLLWYVQPRSDFVVLYEVSYCVLYCAHIWLVLSHAHHDTHTHTLSLSFSLSYHQTAISTVIIAMYVSLGGVLICRYVYLELRERSSTIVGALKFMRPYFERLVFLERLVLWKLGIGDDELKPPEQNLGAEWSFLRPDDKEAKSDGIDETKIELVKRLWRRWRNTPAEPAAAAGEAEEAATTPPPSTDAAAASDSGMRARSARASDARASRVMRSMLAEEEMLRRLDLEEGGASSLTQSSSAHVSRETHNPLQARADADEEDANAADQRRLTQAKKKSATPSGIYSL